MEITNRTSLKAAIIELENRKLVQEEELIAQYKATRESLRPLNLIKDGFTRLKEMPGIGESLLKTVAGIGVGVLSKKLFLGKSPTLIKKLLSGVFEFAVAKTSIDNADKIKAFGTSLYHNLFKKRSNHTNQE